MVKEDEYYSFDLNMDELLSQSGLDEIMRAKDLEQRKLFLEGEVNKTTASDIVRNIMQYNAEDKQKPQEERKPILLYISSEGGEVDAGFAIIDVIKSSKTPVYTINLGGWYSMSFLIGIAGHKRFATKNAKFLMHEGFASVGNSTYKIQDQIDFQKRIEESIKDYVVNHSKISGDEYNARRRDEWYMFADEAKEKGLVDFIIGEDCDIDMVV